MRYFIFSSTPIIGTTTLIVTYSASAILIYVGYKCKSENQADAIDNSKLR